MMHDARTYEYEYEHEHEFNYALVLRIILNYYYHYNSMISSQINLLHACLTLQVSLRYLLAAS